RRACLHGPRDHFPPAPGEPPPGCIWLPRALPRADARRGGPPVRRGRVLRHSLRLAGGAGAWRAVRRRRPHWGEATDETMSAVPPPWGGSTCARARPSTGMSGRAGDAVLEDALPSRNLQRRAFSRDTQNDLEFHGCYLLLVLCRVVRADIGLFRL